MAKGKKFTAAEKHFQEKEVRLRREVRDVGQRLRLIQEDADAVYAENQRLIEENHKLRERNAALQHAAGLSDEQVAELLKRARNENELASIARVFGRMLDGTIR